MKTCLLQPVLIKIFNAKIHCEMRERYLCLPMFPACKELTRGNTVLVCKGQMRLKSSRTPNMRHIRAQKSGTSTRACPHQYAEGKSPASRSWERAWSCESKWEEGGDSAEPKTAFLILLRLHYPRSSLPWLSPPLPSKHFQFCLSSTVV